MKLTLAILVVILSAQCYAQSNHFLWGSVGQNDTRVHYEIVRKSSSFMKVVTKDIPFPSKGDPANYKPITGIRITDQITNGSGGYASILSGGISFNSVTIHFKSQRNNGFNFIMEVFVK